ncbi:phosphatidate cytidylyltransferase [Anoxynatronum buryatiense]|uniref:Phosphatidate cytidylyltransferase n=1 Tax=Anoxynatronum buryatiense TaxID=489973 RepID=A0AA45WVB3_9CLOT|nr:phosphatidate cytidylyltransferase [Anoxynatronum buryatiense]SMP47488.1 phosphatidate cytidylyltransferase [Anoxynatronum buryatiense]
MGKRILTTIVGLPILFYILTKGSHLLTLSLMTVSIIGLHEFYHCARQGGFNPVAWTGYSGTGILYIGFFLVNGGTAQQIAIPMTLVILLVVWVIHHKTVQMQDTLITWFGFIYVAVLLYQMLLIEELLMPHALWLVFIISWGCDSGAYLTGYAMGRRKLCPSISPKKTVEGAVGGIVGSMLGCLIFSKLLMPDHLPAFLLLGCLGAIVSQFGDLSASLIKRTVGIKDFGRLFPGHGGILDRFDSILLTAPFVYLFLKILILR